MTAFTIVWIGQVVSLLGTGMTRFALGIWAWQETGMATPLALWALASFGPGVILSPVAGALVDRWNRKFVMMASDLAAGASTVALLILFATGKLEIWHLLVAGAFASAFESFQFPAYSAAVTMMLNKEQYARASGMMSIAESASQIISPFLAGSLMGLLGLQTGLQSIMTIDVVTFVFAIGALLLVHIPQPARSEADQQVQTSLWEEIQYGFRYILERPSLLGLQLVFFSINLTATFAYTVMGPMILARTDTNTTAFGIVQAVSGFGGLAGGLLLSIWGGPKRKVNGVLGGMALESLLGPMLMGLGRAVPLWSIGGFFSQFFIPIINGSNQAIWQSKVAPDVQGRVFATRRWIAQITAPIAMLASGPLADYVFEPAMRPGGALVPLLGPILGTEPGAGMSVMFLIAGALGLMVGLSGYLFPAVRNAETILPDHEPVPEERVETSASEAPAEVSA
jgi:MFS family permease